jgi:hypothetical protein
MKKIFEKKDDFSFFINAQLCPNLLNTNIYKSMSRLRDNGLTRMEQLVTQKF